jgi:P-type conjugative transfer protein TrbJ
MIRLRHLAAASSLLLAFALTMPFSTPVFIAPALAQSIVFDPNNYAQNVLTAARELQQINNQITALQNQAQMLINTASLHHADPGERDVDLTARSWATSITARAASAIWASTIACSVACSFSFGRRMQARR